jgi:TonB-linked SusC/RagA family outer membrane protein
MQKTADCGWYFPLAPNRRLASAIFRAGKREGRHNLAKIMLVMRLTVLLLTAALVQVHAAGLAQSVTLTGKGQPLKQVFSAIEKQTGYVVFSKKGTLADTKPVTFSAQNMPLRDFLDVVLKGQPLQYVISGKTIMLTRKMMPPAPVAPVHEEPVVEIVEAVKQVIEGMIIDTAGKPLVGATVSIKGKPGMATTDNQGRFKISAEPGDVLTVSYVGYKNITLKVTKDTKVITLTMAPAATVQDDVVITGIFNKPKESYTGATRVITEKEIKQFQGRNIFVTLGNIDPSFNVVTNNSIGSDPNKVPEIQLRGTRNLPNIDQFQAGGAGTQTIRDQQFQYSAAALNAPLIIMDGFPITLQRMMDINVNEIQNVTLLKDGSATALYGSKGANGVIVITTKQPQSGKLRATYRGSTTLNLPDLSSYHLLNARDKLALEKASGYYSNPTKTPADNLSMEAYYNQILGLVDAGLNTDWLRIPLHTQADQNHSLRLEGGDASFRYALEGQYNRINGVMKGSNRETVNGTATISYRLNKLNFSNSLRIGSNKSNESPWGSFSDYAKLNPYWSPYDDKGNVVQSFKPFNYPYWVQANKGSNPYANPMYDATLNTFTRSAYTNINENFQVDYRPVNHLTLNGGISINSTQGTGDDFKPASHSAFSQYSAADVFRKGSYNYSTSKEYQLNGRAQAIYNNLWSGVHGLTVGVSGEINETKTTSYNIAAEGFPDETVDFLGRALQYQQGGAPTGSEGTTRQVGLVSSLNYMYDDRYFVDLTYRVDGASQFGTDKRFAPFYAVGGGWNLHKERFFRDLKYIDRLKLRGSFGVTGNQAFSAYQPLATYSYILNDRYKNWIGATQSTLGNPDLQWQQTDKVDVGVDAQLLNDRIFITADYYTEKTSNLLSSLDLPYSNGFTSYVENIGELQQKGWEVTARVTILRNDCNCKNRFTWSVSGNIAHNEDKIVKLSEALKAANEKLALQTDYTTNLPNKIIREGASQNTIYAVPSLGIDPSTGKELYLNRFGEVTYTWNAADRVNVGLSQPKYRGNVSTLFRYGGFTFNASFGYRFGGQIYNQTLIDKIENADRWLNVDQRVFTDRWQKPGDHAAFRGLNETAQVMPSSRFVQNESTFTCQNMNLSYDVTNRAFLKRLRMQALQLSANTGELFYISTVRQERGLDYPYTRQVSFFVYATF